jgi:hypothetical protein
MECMRLVQDEVSIVFERECRDEGEVDLLAFLSDVFTLTRSRYLFGEEIRKKWNSSGSGEFVWSIDAESILFSSVSHS